MPITIESPIRIQAPPEIVWHLLSDLERYPEWNPFITAISGEWRVGGSLRVQIQLPNRSRPSRFRPRILSLSPNKELRWKGRAMVPGLFTGEHWFRLAPTHYGTLFEQGERFTGLLAKEPLAEATREGFVAMNEALRAEAEDLYRLALGEG